MAFLPLPTEFQKYMQDEIHWISTLFADIVQDEATGFAQNIESMNKGLNNSNGLQWLTRTFLFSTYNCFYVVDNYDTMTGFNSAGIILFKTPKTQLTNGSNMVFIVEPYEDESTKDESTKDESKDHSKQTVRYETTSTRPASIYEFVKALCYLHTESSDYVRPRKILSYLEGQFNVESMETLNIA